jgi:hypothetical protein
MNPEPIIAYLNGDRNRGGAARLANGAGVRESVVNYWRRKGHIPRWHSQTIREALNLPQHIVEEACAVQK